MIQRARLIFLAAVILAVVIVVGEIPLGALVHEKATIAASSRKLQILQNENNSLSQAVSSLEDPSTIERIAHAQYGLIERGQRAYVILPGPGDDTTGPSPLSSTLLSPEQIVPNDAAGATAAAGSGHAANHNPSLWSQIEQRLEFWRWAF
jgi:cell division protein FtsB